MDCVTTTFPKTMELDEVKTQLMVVKLQTLKSTYFNRKGVSKKDVVDEIVNRFQ